MTQVTGVLKYWQDRTNSGFNSDGTLDPDNPEYGFRNEQDYTDQINHGGGSSEYHWWI